VITDVNVGGGTVSVVTETSMKATAKANSAGFSGAVNFGVMHPVATINGRASSYIRDGVDLDAGALTLQAGSLSTSRIVNNAFAESKVFKFAGLASGAVIDADATANGTVEAFVGAASGRTGGGTPGAHQNRWACEGRSGVRHRCIGKGHWRIRGSGAGVNVMQPTADAGGITRAYAGDGVEIRASKLELDADGDVFAEAHTLAIAAGGIGAAKA
jgi:hypothetical protein